MRNYVLLFVVSVFAANSFAMSNRSQILNQEIADQRQLDVDWQAFIGKQDLYWTALPKNWHESLFIGNGLMGSMMFQADDNRLVIQVGRSDVQDHRAQSGKSATKNMLVDQGRLPIGYFTLDTVGTITGCDLRLNLWDAEISGTISTDLGDIDLTALIHSEKMLLVVKAAATDKERGLSFEWHPEEAFSPRIVSRRIGGKQYLEDYVSNPSPVVTEEGDLNVCLQELLAGGQTATAWHVRNVAKDTQILYASVGHSFPETTAKKQAVSIVNECKAMSVEKLA